MVLKLDVLSAFILISSQYNVPETVNEDGKKNPINADISLRRSWALINKPVMWVHYLRCVAYVCHCRTECINASTFSVA